MQDASGGPEAPFELEVGPRSAGPMQLVAFAPRACQLLMEATVGAPWQAYIANYCGHGKTDRLLFIAERSAGKPLELEALRLAHDELKKARLLCAASAQGPPGSCAVLWSEADAPQCAPSPEKRREGASTPQPAAPLVQPRPGIQSRCPRQLQTLRPELGTHMRPLARRADGEHGPLPRGGCPHRRPPRLRLHPRPVCAGLTHCLHVRVLCLWRPACAT
jgi:hypothetical protein